VRGGPAQAIEVFESIIIHLSVQTRMEY
jgi:hypothetical protein